MKILSPIVRAAFKDMLPLFLPALPFALLFIANEVVGLAKLQRLVRLHRRCLHLDG